MIQSKKHISELYSEIKEWESNALFMKDEIKTFNMQLGEVAKKYTHHDVMAEVEHFQNQFIRHNEVCDELLHELHLSEHTFAELALKNPASDHIILNDHAALREKADLQMRIFGDLKHDFHNFLARYL